MNKLTATPSIYVVSFVNFAIDHRDEDICSSRTSEVMTPSLQFLYLELGRLKAKLGEEVKFKSSARNWKNSSNAYSKPIHKHVLLKSPHPS